MLSTENRLIVVAILKVLLIFAEEKEILNICRRQKFLTTFLKLFSDAVLGAQPSDLATADEHHIAVLITHLLAKITLNNKKN